MVGSKGKMLRMLKSSNCEEKKKCDPFGRQTNTDIFSSTLKGFLSKNCFLLLVWFIVLFIEDRKVSV